MAQAQKMTKSALFAFFADKFEVKRTEVRDWFEELSALAEKELKRSGEFTLYYSYNVPGQARDLNTAIKTLLQTGQPAKPTPVALLNPLITISKADMGPASCWALDEVRKAGG